MDLRRCLSSCAAELRPLWISNVAARVSRDHRQGGRIVCHGLTRSFSHPRAVPSITCRCGTRSCESICVCLGSRQWRPVSTGTTSSSPKRARWRLRQPQGESTDAAQHRDACANELCEAKWGKLDYNRGDAVVEIARFYQPGGLSLTEVAMKNDVNLPPVLLYQAGFPVAGPGCGLMPLLQWSSPGTPMGRPASWPSRS